MGADRNSIAKEKNLVAVQLSIGNTEEGPRAVFPPQSDRGGGKGRSTTAEGVKMVQVVFCVARCRRMMQIIIQRPRDRGLGVTCWVWLSVEMLVGVVERRWEVSRSPGLLMGTVFHPFADLDLETTDVELEPTDQPILVSEGNTKEQVGIKGVRGIEGVDDGRCSSPITRTGHQSLSQRRRVHIGQQPWG